MLLLFTCYMSLQNSVYGFFTEPFTRAELITELIKETPVVLTSCVASLAGVPGLQLAVSRH